MYPLRKLLNNLSKLQQNPLTDFWTQFKSSIKEDGPHYTSSCAKRKHKMKHFLHRIRHKATWIPIPTTACLGPAFSLLTQAKPQFLHWTYAENKASTKNWQPKISTRSKIGQGNQKLTPLPKVKANPKIESWSQPTSHFYHYHPKYTKEGEFSLTAVADQEELDEIIVVCACPGRGSCHRTKITGSPLLSSPPLFRSCQ